MKYSIEKIESIDINDLLLLWSVAGHTVLLNYPFHFWPHLKTDDEKRDHFFNGYFSLLNKPNGIVWKSTLNDKIVAINAGTVVDRIIHWELSIIGYDENGRRDWLTADWATTERNAFWERCGVDGWKMKVVSSPQNTIVRYFEDNMIVERDKGDNIQVNEPNAANPLPFLRSLQEIDVVKGPPE